MPTFSSAELAGVGHRADRHQRVRAGDRAAVGERDDHAVAVAAHRLRPRLREDLHAALGEDVLQHGGGVGVLARQHPVAAGHERDLGAHLDVGRHELRPGDAGADDDQVLGQLGEVVELAPGEDALAVGLGVVEHARGGAGGDQHDVGGEHLAAAVGRAGLDGVQPRALGSSANAAVPRMIRTPSRSTRARTSADWAMARLLTRALTRGRSTPIASRSTVHAEVGGAAELDPHPGGGDERLGRDAVVEHAGAAHAVALDDGDVRHRAGPRRAPPRSPPGRRP